MQAFTVIALSFIFSGITVAGIRYAKIRLPPRPSAAVAAAVIVVTLLGVWSSQDLSYARPWMNVVPQNWTYQSPASAGSRWPGWQGITHLIVFGDSYSQTGFTPEGQAPSDALPLGNPDPPSQWTAVNGPSWLEFLAMHHNVSAFKAINFARGGAMVDGDIVKPLSPEIITVKQQVREVYMPNYGYDAAVDRDFNWKPDSSLFAFWIGINDVVGASTEGYPGGGGGHLMRDMATYATLVDEVYQSGARNFLFFTVPCIERSPLFLSGLFGKAKERNLAKNTLAFNDQIVAMANNLTTTYPDAWAHVFDSHLLFRKIIEEPCLYPETCAYKNTTTFCKSYEGGTFGDWYAKYDDCPLPVDQYFWLDFLHPTFRVMNATARVLSKELSEQRVILHG